MLDKRSKVTESRTLVSIITFQWYAPIPWDICVNISKRELYKRFSFASLIPTSRQKIIDVVLLTQVTSVNMLTCWSLVPGCIVLLTFWSCISGTWSIWELTGCSRRSKTRMILVFKWWLTRLSRDKRSKETKEASIGLFFKESTNDHLYCIIYVVCSIESPF